MKRFGMCVCTLAIFLFVRSTRAQDSPWNGSWKLDPSTLKYDGPTKTIAAEPDGYTVTRQGKASPKVVCNGKPNPPYKGVVTTCTKTSTGYSLQSIRDDKSTRKVKMVISPDGNTLTESMELSPVNDSPFTMTIVSKKVSGGSGSPTVWKQTSLNESQEQGLLTIMVKSDSIDFKESDAVKPVTCKLDGSPTEIGAYRSVSIKPVGKHTLKVTYSSKGEVDRVNTFELSPDGKTIQEVDVTPAPSQSTTTVVFHKE
jgi:hypothetical protein